MNSFRKMKIGPIGIALLAAVLYGISAPASKILLEKLPPTFMAALLYLGAGLGMLVVHVVRVATKRAQTEARLTRKEMPYIIGMVALDIAAPIFLMMGIARTTAASAALLNNFEIVATVLIALMIFREAVGKRVWIAIVLIITASVILSIEDFGSFTFSVGSIFVLAACLCWGVENNFTRKLSIKDPMQIVVIKGFGSGIGALIISVVLRQYQLNAVYIIFALVLGFFAFGLSIYFYIKAQRQLGAARTSAYYAAAPFIGVLISWIVLREAISWTFVVALVIMLAGAYFAVTEKHKHKHVHEKNTHEHKHSFDDGHHNHIHEGDEMSEHSHEHTHEEQEHEHPHSPDAHHRHRH